MEHSHLAGTSQKKAKASQLASGSDSAVILVESYWDSPEAKKLFLGSSTDNRSVVNVLQQRTERLHQVNRSPDGWRDLIDKHDVDNLFSSYDIFIIQLQCSMLCLAYIVALEETNTARWVQDCYAQAVYDSNRMGIEAATSKLTVAGWNILLQGNRDQRYINKRSHSLIFLSTSVKKSHYHGLTTVLEAKLI